MCCEVIAFTKKCCRKLRGIIKTPELGDKRKEKKMGVFLEVDKLITSMDEKGKVTIKFRFANQRHPEDEEKFVTKELDDIPKNSSDYAEFLQKQYAAGAKIWVELSSEVKGIDCESKSSSNGMK